jgi:hypothetical protein
MLCWISSVIFASLIYEYKHFARHRSPTMLPRDHFVSRFLYFTTAGVKCCVAAVKSCPVLHFIVVIFFWSFGIIDASTIKC